MAKKKTWIVLIVLAILVACLPVGGMAEDTALVQNPNFDSWVEDGNLRNWEFETSDYQNTISYTQDNGNDCIVIDNFSPAYSYVYQEIPVEANTFYRVSCVAKVENLSGEGTGANISLAGETAVSNVLTDETGWQPLALYFRTGSEATTVSLRIGLGQESTGEKGSAYFDTVSVKPVDGFPAGVTPYVLGQFGSIAATDDASSDDSDSNPLYEYDNWALAVWGALICLVLYLFISSRWAKQWGGYIKSPNTVILVFAAALILRIIIAYQAPGHTTDMECFKGWAMYSYSDGLNTFYDGHFFADYPPAYIYVLYVLGALQNALQIPWQSETFTFMIKLPAIIADLILGYAVYSFAKKRVNPLVGVLLGGFVVLNPALIVDSSSWGQMDSILVLAIVGCAYLTYKNKKFFAALLLVLGILIKPQAVIFAPVLACAFLADLFRKKTWKRTLGELVASLAGGAVLYLIIIWPFKGDQSVFFMVERLVDSLGTYTSASVNAFNLFGLFGGNFVSYDTMLGFMSYEAWGYLLMAIVLILSVVVFFLKRDKKPVFLIGAFLFAGTFMLGHNMHERYILPAIILLLFAAAQYRSKKLLLCSAMFSATLAVNMLVVLQFGTHMLPAALTSICSLVNVVFFGYFVYAAYTVLFREPKEDLAFEYKELETTFKDRADKKATERLSLPTDRTNGKMRKKDWIIMLAITAVYAVVAFTNLGSLTIPENGVQADGEKVIEISLSQAEDVSTLKYYAGYGEADFDVYVSTDGVNYSQLNTDVFGNHFSNDADSAIEHRYKDEFKWHMLELDETIQSIRLVQTWGDLDVREVALADAQENLYPITVTVNEEPAPALCDEQDVVPDYNTYMQDMYFDEVYHARTAYEYEHDLDIYEITHPPLGKSIICIGIDIFGFNPFGWRFMGTLTGVLMLPLMYIFAKRIFKKTMYACIPTVLFAADFMHYAQTRISTIDSYSILFIMLMYFFMYEYMQRNFHKDPLWKTFIPLGLCGLAFGVGAATKWLCIYAGAGLAILFFYTLYQRYREYRVAKQSGEFPETLAFKKKCILTLLFCVAFFIVIPLIIYLLSYIPYFESDPEFGFQGILDNQSYMFNYHSTLDPDVVHPFSSKFYSWPLDMRPVFFFQCRHGMEGMVAGISSFGNPILWWGGIAATIYLLAKRKSKWASFKGLPFIAIAAASQFLPWVLISREVFIYHYFATVPFMILAITYALRDIYACYKRGKWVVYGFAGLCIVAFIAFYPMITGIPVPESYANAMRWLLSWPFY